MTDLNLNTQEAFDRLEDIDESWALKLLDECNHEIHSTNIDHQEIYVEPTEQSTYSSNIPQVEQTPLSTFENSVEFNCGSETTAIERQINLKAEQANSEPLNAEKSVQGFWSFFRKNKAVS